jgi:hypothetical protein
MPVESRMVLVTAARKPSVTKISWKGSFSCKAAPSHPGPLRRRRDLGLRYMRTRGLPPLAPNRGSSRGLSQYQVRKEGVESHDRFPMGTRTTWINIMRAEGDGASTGSGFLACRPLACKAPLGLRDPPHGQAPRTRARDMGLFRNI